MIICGKCGASLKDSDNFCETCGSAVHDINSLINDLQKKTNDSALVLKDLNDLRKKLNNANSEIVKLQNELRLKDKNIQTTASRNQQILKDAEKKADVAKSAKKTIIAVWLITLILATGIFWGAYSDLERRYRDLSTREGLLSQEYDRLLENHSSSMQWWPISITGIVIQNWDDKKKAFLSEPDQDLYAAEIKFFNVKINFDSKVYGDFDFYVKLWDPYGSLFTADSSPPGYSFYKETYNIYRGTGQSKDLDGISGIFSQGQWTVEIWFSGVCIAATAITLK
jgi:hypothetical protein